MQRHGFKPFDYSKAGVYGSDEWWKKAQLPLELMEQFDRVAAMVNFIKF